MSVERFGPEQYVGAIELLMEFQKKKFVTKERYDVGSLSKAFAQTFTKQVFSVGQTFVFKFAQQDEPMFKCTVKKMTAVRLNFGPAPASASLPLPLPLPFLAPQRCAAVLRRADILPHPDGCSHSCCQIPIFRSRGRWWLAPTTPQLRPGLRSPSAW